MSQHNIVPRLAISAALGGLLYGYDTAVINGATTVIKEHFHTGDAVLGLAVGSALITGCVGALLSGRIADKIGRVPMMMNQPICVSRLCAPIRLLKSLPSLPNKEPNHAPRMRMMS